VSTTIIINPISGGARAPSARARLELAREVVAAHGVAAEVHLTERVGHGRELAAAALAGGARLVLAWGGDGTINEVASALAFGDAALGIVPAGSGNGLARELGVDARADRAIADALHAAPRSIDIGEIDGPSTPLETNPATGRATGRLFANMAGVGFDAHIAAQFAAATRRGFVGYAGITARALTTYVPQHYRVTVDGIESTHRAILVTIANSAQFGNNARIAPGARVDDGELDLVVLEEESRWATLREMPRLFDGTVHQARACQIRRIREVTIEAEQPMPYHVDGEPVAGGTRLTARVHPSALRIAVR
jgi:YegS/Rv2252/BmrU family lipid kinase